MRSISFENLRRLVSRKKDRNEPSFKRSESFKRISIRKSYLDRGKRRNKIKNTNNDLSTSTNGVILLSSNDDGDNDDRHHHKGTKECDEEIETTNYFIHENTNEKIKNHGVEGTIGYDEWLNGVNGQQEKLNDDLESIVVKQQPILKQTKIIKPPRKSKGNKTPESITKDLSILHFDSSPIFKRCSKTNSIDSTMIEIIPDPIDDISILSQDNSLSITSIEGPPSVSVSLGRVWLDSVPIPFPPHGLSSSSSIASGAATTSIVHHSLDSGLKERKQTTQYQISRTVSAPEKTRELNTNCDFSSFAGFSLLSSKKCDIKTKRNGFFRKKLSSSKSSTNNTNNECYFKRTMINRPLSGRSKKYNSQTKIYFNDSVNNKNIEGNKLINDNCVWFVPPEKRSCRRKRGVWQEIRYFNVDNFKSMNLDTKLLNGYNWSLNLSDDFDDQQLLLSGDFNERQELLNSIQSSSSSTMTSSFLSTSSSKSSHTSGYNQQPKISDFNEDKIFSMALRGILAQQPIWQPSKDVLVSKNFFASKQFLNYIAAKDTKIVIKQQEKLDVKKKYNGSYYRCLSSSESEIDENDKVNERKKNIKDKNKYIYGGYNVDDVDKIRENNLCEKPSRASKRRPLRRKSQLKRSNGAGPPVYLVRKCSSLRRRSSKIHSLFSLY